MNLKTKLIALCSMFSVVITLLIVGVWCLTNVGFNMGGNVSFKPGVIIAKVEGTVSGTKTQITLPTLGFEDKGEMPDTRDWANMNLEFKDQLTPIVITVTITNLSTYNGQVYMTNSSNLTNVKTEIKVGSKVVSGLSSRDTVTQGNSITYTFTLTILDGTQEGKGTFNVNFQMDKAPLAEPSYDLYITKATLGEPDTSFSLAAFSYQDNEYLSDKYISNRAFALPEGFDIVSPTQEQENITTTIPTIDENTILSNYLLYLQGLMLQQTEGNVYSLSIPSSMYSEFLYQVAFLTAAGMLDIPRTMMSALCLGIIEAEWSNQPFIDAIIANPDIDPEFTSILQEIVDKGGIEPYSIEEKEYFYKLFCLPTIRSSVGAVASQLNGEATPWLSESVTIKYFKIVEGSDISFNQLMTDLSSSSPLQLKTPIQSSSFEVSSYFTEEAYLKVDTKEFISSSQVIDGDLYSSDGSRLIRYATLKQDQEFTLPENVTSIANDAFTRSNNLDILNINLSQKECLTGLKHTKDLFVTRIKGTDYVSRFDLAEMYQICDNTANLEIVYLDNAGLTYVEGNDGYMVSGWTKETKVIDIPSTFIPTNGIEKPVVGIKTNAFKGNNTVTGINLPSSLKVIENNAFAGIPNVKQIDFGNAQLSSYGSDVFGGRTDIEIFTQNKTTKDLIKTNTANSTSIDMSFLVENSASPNSMGSAPATLNGSFVVTFKIGSHTFSIDTTHSLEKWTDLYNGYMIIASPSNETLNLSISATIDAEGTPSVSTNPVSIDHIQEQIAIGKIESDGSVTFITGTPKDQTYFNHPGDKPVSVSYPATGESATAQVGDDLKLVVNFNVMYYVQCFTEGTLVTLADGSTKAIEDVTYDDLLLVWDFDRGEFSYSYPVWIAKSGQYSNYYLMKFDDGSEVEIVLSHRLFNTNNLSFEKSIDALYSQVGQPFFRQTLDENGNPIITTPICISIEKIEKTCTYYNMVTSQSLNFFANGFLGSTGIANMYTFEKTEDGRYIHNQEQLLDTKGNGREENLDVFSYDMFDPNKISYEIYISYRLGELKNMADILSKVPPYSDMPIDKVYAYAISIVNDYFKDNYFEDMISWPDLFKITNSDGLVQRINRKSQYVLPQPKDNTNFVGWYNTFDGKIYLPGESATIYMNTHFIARYSIS